MIGKITASTAIQRHARPEPQLRGAAFGCLREEICWDADHGVLVWVLVGTRWMLERLGESDLFFGDSIFAWYEAEPGLLPTKSAIR